MSSSSAASLLAATTLFATLVLLLRCGRTEAAFDSVRACVGATASAPSDAVFSSPCTLHCAMTAVEFAIEPLEIISCGTSQGQSSHGGSRELDGRRCASAGSSADRWMLVMASLIAVSCICLPLRVLSVVSARDARPLGVGTTSAVSIALIGGILRLLRCLKCSIRAMLANLPLRKTRLIPELN